MKPTTTNILSNSSAMLESTMSNTNFESYYHNICASLQSKGEVHSVSKIFAQLPTDDERVKFVLEHRLLTGAMTFQWWKDYNFVQKDRTESQRLKMNGRMIKEKLDDIKTTFIYAAVRTFNYICS